MLIVVFFWGGSEIPSAVCFYSSWAPHRLKGVDSSTVKIVFSEVPSEAHKFKQHLFEIEGF